MNESLNYTVFNTGMGWMGILASARGLRQVTLPCPSAREARQLLGRSIDCASQSPHPFRELVERFTLYFGGNRVNFTDKLDFAAATAFQREVWETARLIPYGETGSYRWIAEKMNKPGAARAVGQALGRNPLPIIVPCHRVLASDGRLGGFSGGLDMKRNLLRLEGLAGFA